MKTVLKDWLKTSWLGERLIRRTPPYYALFRSLLRRTENMLLQERAFWSGARVRRTLAGASRSAYGRQLGLGPHETSLADWPLLTKELLRDQVSLFEGRSFLPVADASTSGTTGLPLSLRRSWRSVVFEQSVIDFLAEKYGASWRKDRIAILRGDTIKDPSDMTPPFWRYRHGDRHLAMSSNHLNARTVPDYVKELERFDPEIFWVYPTALEALLGFVSEGQLNLPKLKMVFSTSEVLAEKLHAEVNRKLNVPVCDYYGQAERVCASWSTESETHYFLPAYGRVELLPGYSDDGHDYLEVVGTAFWNEAQPLVRYRTGDYAKVEKGLNSLEIESICLGERSFKGVVGRQSDYLIALEGTHLMGIDHIPRGIPSVVQMQFVQTGADIVINVVAANGYSDDVSTRIIQQARKKIPSSLSLKICLVEQLQRTSSGKAPLVIRQNVDFDEK